jgi:hypothetical protein
VTREPSLSVTQAIDTQAPNTYAPGETGNASPGVTRYR